MLPVDAAGFISVLLGSTCHRLSATLITVGSVIAMPPGVTPLDSLSAPILGSKDISPARPIYVPISARTALVSNSHCMLPFVGIQ